MIDPGTNKKGEKVHDYCHRRWGSSGWTRHLISEGKKDGAKFADWKWWPHTLKAHQLVQYYADKKQKNQQSIISTDLVNKMLFQAEYEQGENIANVEPLMDIAKKLKKMEEKENSNDSTDLKELQKYLEKDLGAQKVKQEIDIGRRQYRISGVPYFVVSNGKERPYGFSGAQSSQTFLNMFEELSDD